MLKPVLTGSPVEVTIVGDVGEEVAKRAVAATFGALPPWCRPLPPCRTARARSAIFRGFAAAAGDGIPSTGPLTRPPRILAWPLYVAVPERRRGYTHIHLLRSILETRLLQAGEGRDGQGLCPRRIARHRPTMLTRACSPSLSKRLRPSFDLSLEATLAVAGELAGGAISQAGPSTPPERRCSPGPMRRSAGNESWATAVAYTGKGAGKRLRELTGLRERPRRHHPRRGPPSRRHLAQSPTPLVARALPAPR